MASASDATLSAATTGPHSGPGPTHPYQAGSRRIVIFADGTGNAFTTQESNIWRLFLALDKNKPDQIVHYIRGVGTSGFRPWAMLDGATGFGVPSNVRQLYSFLCVNWLPGDEIYLFGFSRGAFTVRTLAAFISNQGLIPRTFPKNGKTVIVTHAEMEHYTRAAWRAYRKEIAPAGHRLLIWGARAIRDFVAARLVKKGWWPDYRQLKQSVHNGGPMITFLGVFDTVEAYGVPFEFLRRPIDWLFWPMEFRSEKAPPSVLVARQALSLDDERTTFHPLPFKGLKDHADVQQVWFAGAHSDVGGGYPDSALAHEALIWMAREAARGRGRRSVGHARRRPPLSLDGA
jgi:uncharacterized protein (DUF2235 family)